MNIESRFWSKVNKTRECWIWTAYVSRSGYGQIGVEGKIVKAHRLAYTLLVGPIPAGMEIDHICHVRSCVNPAHLRLATHAENKMNSKLPKNNISGFKGVRWHARDKNWQARITVNRKQINLGYFPTPEAAHAAYREAATRLHGEFANFGEAA